MPKVRTMFEELGKTANRIISETVNVHEAAGRIVRIVSSETASRSNSIMSDMLFDLNDELMASEFFTSDIVRQNRFYEFNLRKEILDKYQFESCATLNFKDAEQQIARMIKVIGCTATGVTIVGAGAVLIRGLALSSLVAPIPVGILVFATIGVTLTDYLTGSNKDRRALRKAIDDYLHDAQRSFLNWFDEIERYFNKRTEEFKQTI